MPRTRKKQEIHCQHFRWLLGQRNGVYFADGRSNLEDLGRHSLGTCDRNEALATLKRLDAKMAVQHGLIPQPNRAEQPGQRLSIKEGRRRYEEYVKRPAVSGGPKEATAKRYRAVFDKFEEFAALHGIRSCDEVTPAVLDKYAAWLVANKKAYATQYLELTTIKQFLKFLVREKVLSASSIPHYPLKRSEETDTYCWEREEVVAMLDHCKQHADLEWMGQILTALVHTGLRIGELASLCWSDMDPELKMINLPDESRRGRHRNRAKGRTTKSGRGRSIPIHRTLKVMLQDMQQMECSEDGLVFHGPHGGRVNSDKVRKIFVKRVLEPLAGRFSKTRFIEGRFHSFRHYFCSVAADNHVAEQVLMSWLGHRHSKMTRRYYHLKDAESLRQMDRLNALTDSAVTQLQPDPVHPNQRGSSSRRQKAPSSPKSTHLAE